MSLGNFLQKLRKALSASAAEPQYDRDVQLLAARNLAAIVDGYIGDLKSPRVLEEKDEFVRGVAVLQVPCFSSRELLTLSDDPSDAIWQMAVKAVSERDPEPELVDRLLELLTAGGPWHQYWVLQALEAHTPVEQSLIGAVIFRLRDHGGPYLEFELKLLAPVMERRLEAGEQPTFAGLLDTLDADGAENLDDTLQNTLASPAAAAAIPLLAELSAWRATFVDLEVLRDIGRIWTTADAAAPLVIDHPRLAALVGDVLAALRRKPRRSVLLIGEHGVGKTAVMVQVGRELLQQDWTVFEAAGADLLAGQSYMGQLEKRVKNLLAQLEGGRRVLWYVPDFQTLAWLGTHQHSRSAILDQILPHLESGQLAMVGELTDKAYEQLVQERPRLAPACEVCRVPPLDEQATLELAAAWAGAMSPADGPGLVSPGVIQEAWLLARQYLRDREAPGCLLEFLDETRLVAAAASPGPVSLGHEDLVAALATLTGLPREILDERQSLDPDDLRAFFATRILGQPEAVTCLVERITLLKAGLTDPTRPQGVFLFAGPTGTGKTEIAKALASYLFGSEDRLLRYDMSEFQAPDSLERLVGDGQNLDRDSLTRKIRKQPFAVVLLDEFEKAHPKVWDLFLQVFDDGRLTDALGRTADFRHAIIILTSNLGGQAATGAGLGFDQDSEGFRASDVGRAVQKAFRPEFLNRLDRVVVFRPFSRDVMREILDKELRDVQQRRGLRNRSWAVVWEDSALEFLLDRGFSPTLGARPLKRAVDRYLLTPLAETIVKGRYPAGDQFLYIQARGERLAVDFIDPDSADEPHEPAVSEEADGTCGGTRVEAPPGLAAIALNPAATPAEFQHLRDHWARLRAHLDSPVWKDAKSLALSMVSLPDFWNSPERFAVLGEVECRERVETGLETAGSLVSQIAAMGNGRREHHPRKLVGQAAGRLHLLELACHSLERRTPWEVALLVESKREPAAEDGGDDALVDRLGAMYRKWGERRKMRMKVLDDVPRRGGRARALLLGVSGYAAYDILAPEAGLHLWEEPDPHKSKGALQRKVQVRVAALPEDRPVSSAEEWLDAARDAMAGTAPGVPPVVRIYRELPDPLVKDRQRRWRTGRLDRVLAGDFDLLGACAEDRAGAGTG